MPAARTTSVDAFAAAAELGARRPIRSARLRQLVQAFPGAPTEHIEQEVRRHLSINPEDADALSFLAQALIQRGRRREAAELLARCLDIAPDFAAARFNYADLLFTLNRFDAALEQINTFLADNPHSPIARRIKAKVLESLGDISQSVAIIAELSKENPNWAESWIEYGHALRAAGRLAECVAAYRKAIELKPDSGLAYINLANLKTFRFSDAELAAMLELSKRSHIDPDDRINLQFALAKAYEDRDDYIRAFEHYAKGNAAVRMRFSYDPDALTAGMRRTKAAFTREFVQARAGMGCPAPDPIFIVGRHRSGSTLIEQILASHSAIEGTAELPYIPDIVAEIADVEGPAGGAHYFENLAKLTPEQLKAYGEAYLERARLHRKTSRSFVIDKNPGNHFHVGLIALILPNAKIIDVRRNPAAVCWSQFTHHFTMTNLRLTEFARGWREYAELMAHFDSVLPGKVHRVFYEYLVTDTEAEVRRLLDYLRVPFEEKCLRFYESERAVLTPSSEQVRRPITREALDHWRHFEPWLGALKAALGSALTWYPDVPKELLST
jgi:tetratricopeptide (TPR) repeat protein